MKGSFLEGRKPGAVPDIKAVVSAALEIAMGMAYLHGRDLIHGDLTGGEHQLQRVKLLLLLLLWLLSVHGCFDS